ncbi:MAG: hypothetical protein KC503_17605 [Myxococcales bacterium]|nr:hypothetical protein [Myxococcales bacterium]
MSSRIVTQLIAAIVALSAAGACGPSRPLPRAAMPKAARRDSPPPGIDDNALAVGATARPFGLVSSAGGSWSLREALSKKPALLVFYRGSW